MTRTFETRAEFGCSAAQLFSLYADPAFQEGRARALGAHTATCAVTSETEAEIVVRLEATRPSFSGRGDESSVMSMTLDRATRGSCWTQTVRGYESRARVEGTSQVVELGPARAELIVRGSIEIRIPIVGRVIESKIVGAMDKLAAREAEYIRKYLAGS